MKLPVLFLSVAGASLLHAAVPQESDESAPPSSVTVVTSDSAEVETTAEELRARIREMRMNLLLGGDQVRRAEREASAFYTEKSRSVERRMDDIATELTELQAKYDIVLDRALSGGGAEALREAQPLKARIQNLEGELDALKGRRARLGELVAAVDERDRERQRLVDQLESSPAGLDVMSMPMPGIGLAPDVMVGGSDAAPLEDDELLNDLLERDPRAAKAMLFAEDPDRYWRRFPLAPPARELRAVLRFPRPDPVGQR